MSTYALCEAVADLAASFIVAPVVPCDSREMNRLCIAWAEEFEKRHAGETWEDRDYIITIDEFFAEKHGAWVNGAVGERRPGDFTSPKHEARAASAAIVMREALEYAYKLIPIARGYFPKAITNPDRFTLENTCATIGNAIAVAREVL